MVEIHWTDDIENVLWKMHSNCVILTKEHKRKYFQYKHLLNYFKLPIIILSGFNSVMSVGLQAYMEQQTISTINCLLALSCGIIGSVELFLGIQKQMESEYMKSKEFYLLSVNIFKTLTLIRENRPPDGKIYLEECYNEYIKLIENANIISKKLNDNLTFIQLKDINIEKSKSFSLSNNSTGSGSDELV